MDKKYVMVSGGFDPVHIGHVRMIMEASKYGEVVVAINSDSWLTRKKGYVFMPWEQRAEIMSAFKHVSAVISFDDEDNTACDAIRKFKPTYFANGGDRGRENTPEQSVCEELGVEMLWSIGGSDKPQSSSWLVNKMKENK